MLDRIENTIAAHTNYKSDPSSSHTYGWTIYIINHLYLLYKMEKKNDARKKERNKTHRKIGTSSIAHKLLCIRYWEMHCIGGVNYLFLLFYKHSLCTSNTNFIAYFSIRQGTIRRTLTYTHIDRRQEWTTSMKNGVSEWYSRSLIMPLTEWPPIVFICCLYLFIIVQWSHSPSKHSQPIFIHNLILNEANNAAVFHSLHWHAEIHQTDKFISLMRCVLMLHCVVCTICESILPGISRVSSNTIHDVQNISSATCLMVLTKITSIIIFVCFHSSQKPYGSSITMRTVYKFSLSSYRTTNFNKHNTVIGLCIVAFNSCMSRCSYI